jgi:hypothetical protein
MSTKVYLVGDKDSLKTNSWLAMTNCLDEVEHLMETLPNATQNKEIEVKPPRSRRKRK